MASVFRLNGCDGTVLAGISGRFSAQFVLACLMGSIVLSVPATSRSGRLNPMSSPVTGKMKTPEKKGEGQALALNRTPALTSGEQQMRRIGHHRLLLCKESIGVNQLFAGTELEDGFHTRLDKLQTACGNREATIW